MSVDFLTTEQKTQYGQFSGDPNEIQLARYFTSMKQTWHSYQIAVATKTDWALRCN